MFQHKTILRKVNFYKLLCLVIALIFAFNLSVFSQAKNDKKFTVVIDPGHGGRDPGAVGRISKEKDLVLAIGLKLRDIIEKNYDDVRVIMTREDDTFVELFRRADIANRNNADLFISLHVNASSNRNANGTETFVMGLHRTSGNLEVAKKENSVILKEEDYEDRYGGFDPNDPESHIIFSLFQNAHLNQSLYMSQLIQNNFSSKLSLPDRGVKQAGFLVLWQTTMPSVLVEAGFISNPEEEKYLVTEEAQTKIAKSIFKAFSQYKNFYQGRDEKLSEEEFSDIIAEELVESSFETKKKKEEKKQKKQISPQEQAEKFKEEGVIFKVQIGASSEKRELVPENFSNYENVQYYYLDGIYRYTIGASSNYEKIHNLRNELSKDFTGCFVVAFKNGERIPINKARKLLKNQ